MGGSNRTIEMISYFKDKYYWFNNYRKLKRFLEVFNGSKILLFGYVKSGNTWLRFLLYNYRELLINPAALETITYARLNSIQNNIMDRGTTFLPLDGFPFFYRTHAIYHRSYTLFDKKVFIHRNPLDTLISSYYFYKNRKEPFFDYPNSVRRRLFDIDFYVVYTIDYWIDFYKQSIQHADIVINYSKLRADCEQELVSLISFLDWDINQELVRKAVEISSFNQVKRMGIETNQTHGMAPEETFHGEFTRSGKEGQFYNELKKETIDLVFKKFPEFKELYTDCLE